MTTTYDQLTVTYDQSTLTYQGLPAQFDGVSFAVEMAFGYEPFDPSPQWEVVTAYVRGFDISRGRNSEFTTYGPGTVSITLDNRDRRFDPEHTTGPYFGDLNPMVPVRVQATYSGVTYTMFYGFVQGWPTVYNQSNTDAVATVTAIDATRLLGNLFLPQAEYIEQMKTESVIYYTLQDEREISVPIVGGDAYAFTWNSSNRSVDMLYPISASKSLTGFLRYIAPLTVPAFNEPMFWFNLVDGVSWLAARVGFRISLTIKEGSTASTLQYFYFSASRAFNGSAVLNIPPGWHMCALTFDTTGFTLWIDNVVVWTDVTVVLAVNTTDNQMIIGAGNGSVSHLSLFSSTIDAALVDKYWKLGTESLRGELSSTRLDRVLDDAGWPSTFRDIETGVQPVGSYAPESLAVPRYYDQIDNAEQGALFVNREGDVEFRSRSTAEAVSPVGLFDDSGTDLPFANVAVDAHTVDAIRNNVVVTYANGSTTSTDAGSVAAYGQASQTVDARLVDDATVAQSIGDTLLARAKDPRTRITRLDVNVRRDPAGIVPVVAALDLSDDVTVSLTPTGVGSALWRAVRVQGITHRVTPQSWDVSLYLAPGPINTNGPLMILDDGTYGVLDSNKLG